MQLKIKRENSRSNGVCAACVPTNCKLHFLHKSAIFSFPPRRWRLTITWLTVTASQRNVLHNVHTRPHPPKLHCGRMHIHRVSHTKSPPVSHCNLRLATLQPKQFTQLHRMKYDHIIFSAARSCATLRLIFTCAMVRMRHTHPIDWEIVLLGDLHGLHMLYEMRIHKSECDVISRHIHGSLLVENFKISTFSSHLALRVETKLVGATSSVLSLIGFGRANFMIPVLRRGSAYGGICAFCTFNPEYGTR